MLLKLSIKNFALIDEIEISFNQGLNVITGETGSGKSIIVDALGMVLGDRADTTIAKDKSQKCIIEANFDVSQLGLKSFFEANDLDFENITSIRREISSQGKSRAFINDTPVTLQIIKELASKIIDIHSQHQTIEINDQSYQLQMVDALAGTNKELEKYQQKYKEFRLIEKEINSLKKQESEALQELDYNNYLLSEFDGLSLIDLNQEELEQELNTLENTEEIKQNLSTSVSLLDDEQAVLSLLKELLSQLGKISEFNSSYNLLNERVNSVFIELKDISNEFNSLLESVEYNPSRIEEITELLNKCYSLQKKHNAVSFYELNEIKNQLKIKVQNVFSLSDKINDLEESLKIGLKELEILARSLSKKRLESFPKIEKQIKTLLSEMSMNSAEIKVIASQKEFSIDGIDEILFKAKTNKGSDLKPIHQIASGGELSRIMLALKTILSKYQKLPSIVFDEIDTGISGEVADKVGSLIRKLSDNLQVFSITHLPQVASKGHWHYFVYKTETKSNTNTQIKLLNQDERIVELAKMMSGEKVTEASMLNAKELLKQNN